MASTDQREIFTVSRLNREARGLLEKGFGSIWVEAEISNFTHHRSGHMYFSLKDEQAQVSCAMFSRANRSLRFKPTEGMQVLVRAKVSIYEAGGRYQLIVDEMEEAGEGRLQREFEKLKQKLLAEGLFDESRKQALPALPKRIGIVTSPSGAALRDVLHVLKRRFPAIPVLIYPVPVQGAGAAGKIAGMLALADRQKQCDILILTRGGGSLEDLWAFNEEVVARAIAACEIPVISAVGHEVDFTIADFVADLRAPTPSAAAEIVTPDQAEWLASLTALAARIGNALRAQLARRSERQTWLLDRLRRTHPGQALRQHSQRLDELTVRLQRAQSLRFERLAARIRELTGMLTAVGPQATLDRGYAIVRKGSQIVRDAAQLKRGDVVATRFAKGTMRSKVEETEK